MKVKYRVAGLHCPHCAERLEAMLNALDEITSAKINFLTEKITVESALAPEALDALMAKAAISFGEGTEITRL